MLTAMVFTAVAPDPMSVLINYGFGGLMILLIILGQLRTKAEVESLKEINAEQREIIRTFQNQMSTQTLPAMARSAQVLEAIPSKEAEMLDELKETHRAMSTLVDRVEAISREQEKRK